MKDVITPPAEVRWVDAELDALARRINAEHADAEGKFQAGLRHAIEAGKLLAEAKGQMKHGGWLRWLKAKTDVSARLAQKYMQVAREADRLGEADAPRVAHLSFRQALDVVAKNGAATASLPQARREEILDKAETGEVKKLRAAVVEAKLEERREKVVAERRQCKGLAVDENWVAREFGDLKALTAKRPEFAARAERIKELTGKRGAIAAEIQRLHEQLMEVERQESRERRDLDLALAEAVEQEFGRAVHADVIFFRDAEALAERVKRSGYSPDSREALLFAANRCLDCEARLREEDQHAVCNWCREHRGITHCDDCGNKLRDGEEVTCAHCHPDVKDLSCKEVFERFLATVTAEQGATA